MKNPELCFRNNRKTSHIMIGFNYCVDILKYHALKIYHLYTLFQLDFDIENEFSFSYR